MSLSPNIGSLPGYAVRLTPDRVVVSSEAGGVGSQNVRENVIARKDVFNGTVSVGTSSTVLCHVPSGAVYEIRIVNTGVNDVFLAVGQLAQLTHYPLSPGQVAQFRIAGEQDLTAISASAGGESMLVWASELL